MSIFPITKFINCDVQTDVEDKWNDFVNGGNGVLYGIPQNASRVLQLDLEDKSLKEIGPNLDGENFNYKGIRAENGSIYCMPGYRTKFFLKITPMEGGDAKVQILKDKPLPRQAYSMWRAEDSWEAIYVSQRMDVYIICLFLPVVYLNWIRVVMVTTYLSLKIRNCHFVS